VKIYGCGRDIQNGPLRDHTSDSGTHKVARVTARYAEDGRLTVPWEYFWLARHLGGIANVTAIRIADS